MWRPEGWEDILASHLSNPPPGDLETNLIEAGADAMLEAVGKHFSTTLFSLHNDKYPCILKQGDLLLIGIKVKGDGLPIYLANIAFKEDYFLKNVSVSGEPLKKEMK